VGNQAGLYLRGVGTLNSCFFLWVRVTRGLEEVWLGNVKNNKQNVWRLSLVPAKILFGVSSL
jgi:hypothetical protein